MSESACVLPAVRSISQNFKRVFLEMTFFQMAERLSPELLNRF